MGNDWFHEYFINELKAIGRKPTSNMQHEVVDSLPSSGNEQTIYFVKNDSSSSNNHYDEYVWISSSNTFEKIGSSQIDGSVPKPLTYDYMPEGYPTKSVQTTTLMEEQEVAFILNEYEGVYMAQTTNTFEVVRGQTYTVNWDGTEYECVGVGEDVCVLGNLSIAGMGDDTGEPFVYGRDAIRPVGKFLTLDTAASHTISVKTVTEVITPMAYDYMPEGYPKKSGCSIEWNGNTEGLVAVDAGSIIICKVSDLTPTDDELIGRFVRFSDGTGVIISSDYIHALTEDITFVGESKPFILVVKKDNATAEGLTFPQKGTYFVKQQNSKAAKPEPLYVQKLLEVITPMAEEFMPPRIVEAIDAVGGTIDRIGTIAYNAQTTANNAVSYAFYQQLTDEQKEQARTNIGVGVSSFSGSWNDLTDKPFKPAGESYLTFRSPNSFTLKVESKTKPWDGTLEYFASDGTWTIWDGKSVLSAIDYYSEYILCLRGIGNTFISRRLDLKWILTGADIKCIGNIENLLDYATVESGAHPTLANSCYQYMFADCTSLTHAPALPSTTLASYCYSNMFKGCTSLIQAPVLPTTTLANNCYSGMFRGCTSLTHAPTLPATTLANYCYYYMFADCTSLTQAPVLPATTFADYCYRNMFYGCASLTQAPVLPATTLANDCYNNMFQGCAGLKLSTTLTNEYTQEYRIPSSGNGTTAPAALSNMFASTGGTFTGTPEINITYYLSSDNMIVRETEIATLNGYVDSMINTALSEIGIAEEGAY